MAKYTYRNTKYFVAMFLLLSLAFLFVGLFKEFTKPGYVVFSICFASIAIMIKELNVIRVNEKSCYIGFFKFSWSEIEAIRVRDQVLLVKGGWLRVGVELPKLEQREDFEKYFCSRVDSKLIEEA